MTYSIIKPGDTFHCNWGGATTADASVTGPAPKSLEAEPPGKQVSNSPWWWPFKKTKTPSKPKPTKKT